MLRRFTLPNSASLLTLASSSSSSLRFQSSRPPPSSKGSSWTALLDDDEDAQKGNFAKDRSKLSIDQRVDKVWKRELHKGTPPELRDSYINEQQHMHPGEKARLERDAELEALDRASQVQVQIPDEQQQQNQRPMPTNRPSGVKLGLWDGGSSTMTKKKVATRSFYGAAEEDTTAAMNKARETAAAARLRAQQELEEMEANQDPSSFKYRPRKESAMSRFFRDNQARDFAARKFEEDDKDRYSPKMPKFNDAMNMAGFGGVLDRDPKEATNPTRVMLDELDGTTTPSGAFGKENPYDSYRQLGSQRAGDAAFEMEEQTRANRSVIPGLGPLIDTLYWRIEQSAEQYKINKPQKEDRSVPFYKRVYADVDLTDRRSTMHILSCYPLSEWLFALISAASIFFMTEYQYRHRLLETYDEILGLDSRRGGERLEYLMVMVVSFFFYRFFLFHPYVVGTIGVTRLGRYVTGRPLGPP